MSGKLLWRVSCQTRISSCANCRPVVPVCESSSGSAFCSSSCEKRNAGPLRRGDLEFRVLVEEPTGVLAENPREHLQHLGGGHALARFHHAEIGHRRRPLGVDLDAARRQFVQGEAVAFAQAAQFRSQEVTLTNQSRHMPLRPTQPRVKFTM